MKELTVSSRAVRVAASPALGRDGRIRDQPRRPRNEGSGICGNRSGDDVDSNASRPQAWTELAQSQRDLDGRSFPPKSQSRECGRRLLELPDQPAVASDDLLPRARQRTCGGIDVPQVVVRGKVVRPRAGRWGARLGLARPVCAGEADRERRIVLFP